MTNHLDQTNERKEVGKRQTTQKEKKKKKESLTATTMPFITSSTWIGYTNEKLNTSN